MSVYSLNRIYFWAYYRGTIFKIETKRYRPDEFDTTTWAENGEELCTFYDGKIKNRSSCFDQESKNCDNAVIPMKKGKFYYVTAVHTSANGIASDVFIFIHGYIRGDNALLQCGDNTWEAISNIVLPIIFGVLGLILGLLLVLMKKSVNCCYQIFKPGQQQMIMDGNEISGTVNAPLMRDAKLWASLMSTALWPPAEPARKIDFLSVQILLPKIRLTINCMSYKLSCSSIDDTYVQKSFSYNHHSSALIRSQ